MLSTTTWCRTQVTEPATFGGTLQEDKRQQTQVGIVEICFPCLIYSFITFGVDRTRPLEQSIQLEKQRSRLYLVILWHLIGMLSLEDYFLMKGATSHGRALTRWSLMSLPTQSIIWMNQIIKQKVNVHNIWYIFKKKSSLKAMMVSGTVGMFNLAKENGTNFWLTLTIII